MGPQVVCHHCGRMRSPDPYARCESCGTTRPMGDSPAGDGGSHGYGAPSQFGGGPPQFGGGPSQFGGPQPGGFTPPPPRTSDTTKIILGLAIGLGLCALFSCCGFFGYAGYLAQQVQEQARQEFEHGSATAPSIPPVESSDRLLVVPPYGGLSPTTTLHADAQLQLQNLPAELYVLGFSEPKTGFAPGFTLEQYGNVVTQSMELADKSISQPTVVRFGDRSARQSQVRGSMSALPILYWVTVVETEQHFHQLVIWTLATKEGENGPIAQRIVTESIARSTP